ncbi:hypothetical protein BSKO_02073 [Bryopsis sp. KO-2023]|nr:hypothetical protein BSKO_02073 [Bryopsis sp. KO-2023]
MTCRILLAAEDRKENAPLAGLADQLVSCAATVHVFLVNTGTQSSSLPFEGSVSPTAINAVELLRDEIDAVVPADDSFILTAFGNDDFMTSMQRVAESLETPLCACGNLQSEQDSSFPTLLKRIRESIRPTPYLVGVSMKQSRYAELAGRGVLSLDPSDGLLIVPANCGIPISEMDAVVEKCTDFLQKDEAEGGVLKASKSRAMIDLQEQLAANPEICVIDPFHSVSKVMDRSVFTALMSDMEASGVRAGVVSRISPTPYFTAKSISDINVFTNSMHAAGLEFPVIMKPCVACGVKGSHKHAIVYNKEGLENLQFDGLPACVQSYVNHGGDQYKIYVVGKKVFHRAEPSTPDIHPDQIPSESVLFFDTLESLQSSLLEKNSELNQNTHSAASEDQGKNSRDQQLLDIKGPVCGMCVGVIDDIQEVNGGQAGLDFHAVMVIAKFLKDKLGLTIFGFDVVVQEGTGVHFVVDVNFFPSCKKIPGVEKTIRTAIFERISAHKRCSF